MRIAESSIEMFSGRSFSRSGMSAAGAAYGGGFADKVSKIEKRDSYEPGLSDNAMSPYNMDDLSSMRGVGKTGAANGLNGARSPMGFQNDILSQFFQGSHPSGPLGAADIRRTS